jgi:RHS repeat-associated protein
MKTKHIASAGMGLIALAGHASAEMVGYERYTYDAAGNIVEKQIDGHLSRYEFEGNILKTNNEGITFLHDSSRRLKGEVRNGRAERILEYGYGDKVTHVQEDSAFARIFYNSEGHLVALKTCNEADIFAWDGQGLAMRGENAYAIEVHISGGVPAMIGDQVIVSDYLGSTLSSGNNVFATLAFGDGLEDGLFTGKPFVSGIEGFVFNYRNYSPKSSRWISSDPCGYPDGSNNLAYASCPTTSLDLYGLLDLANAQNSSFSTLVSHGSGAEWWVDIWTAQTDDGASTVDLLKFQSLVTPPPFSSYNLIYNCHGYVHGGSQYWINDPMSPRIILGDGWKEIDETDVKVAGGPYIAVYFVSAHSVNATQWVNGDVEKVKGKGGVDPNPLETTPEDAWPTGPIQFYEK